MALSYLFMDARGPGGTCQGLGGPRPPQPHKLHLSLPLSVTSLSCRGHLASVGEEGAARARRLFQRV